MTKNEALKMALEALEAAYARLVTKCEQNLVTYNGVDVDTLTLSQEAITALKEALAQPEQEPVVWMYQDKSTHEVRFQKHMRYFVDHSKTSEVPLYSEPLANHWRTIGEPLANHELQCVCGAVWCGDEMVHLPNKAPPQRTWVGLTDEEIKSIWLSGKDYGDDWLDVQSIAQAIEAKLKEKNT